MTVSPCHAFFTRQFFRGMLILPRLMHVGTERVGLAFVSSNRRAPALELPWPVEAFVCRERRASQHQRERQA